MSVLELLSELCVKVFDSEFTKAWHPDLPKLRRKALKKLRTKCYEILLHKVSVTDTNYESDWSPAAQVIGHIVTLQEQCLYRDAKKMEECARKMLHSKLHRDPVMNSVLELLLRLQNSIPRQEDYEPELFRYERPSPYEPGKGVVPYNIPHPSTFLPPPWMLDLSRPSKYFPSAFTFTSHTQEPGQALPTLGRFLCPARLDGAGSNVALYTIPQVVPLKEPRGLQIPQLLLEKPLADEGYATPSNEVSRNVSPCERAPPETTLMTVDEIWEAALTFDPPSLRTWETLGQRIVPSEKPFLTEAGKVAAKHFIQVSEEVPGSVSTVAVQQAVPMELLLRDIRYLLLGVQTNTFPFSEEEFAFHLGAGVSVEELSTSSLASFCAELLELGTCTRRLQILSEKGVPGHRRTQLMEALREHVGTYLQFHWGATLLMPQTTSLMSLHHWSHTLHCKTVALARLCGVAPPSASWGGPRRLPTGMALVSYIYEALSEESCPDVCCILYSVLQTVSRVYFRFLQRWIFEGTLFDPWEEFFVQATPSKHPLSRRDRKDWSQTYRVVRDTVPGFLRGLEDDVLLCGKTVHLLKLCCPKATLCVALESGHPPVPCCLRARELRNLSGVCRQFEQRVRSLDGNKDSTATLSSWQQRGPTEAEIQKRQEAIQQAHERHMLRFKLEQEAGRQAVVQKQLQWRTELQQQAQEAQERRQEEQRRERQEELEMLQLEQQRQQEFDRRKELEKQRMIEYYEELSNIAQKRKELANWRLERMNLRDRREEFILNDRRQWHTAASELNLKNAERSLAIIPLTVIEEDGDAPVKAENLVENRSALTLPLANTTMGDGDAASLLVDNSTTNQGSPNNNSVDNMGDSCDVNENVEGSLLNICESSLVSVNRNLLDTTIEDVALGNVLIPMEHQDIHISSENAVAAVDNTAFTDASIITKVCDQEFEIPPSQDEERERKARERERPRVMSAAERNKRKVMDQEFGIIQPWVERPKSVPFRPAVKEGILDRKNVTAELQRRIFEDTTTQRRTNQWNMLHGGINLITGALIPTPSSVSETQLPHIQPDTATVRDMPNDDGGRLALPSPMGTDAPMSKSESSGSVNHVYKTASAQSSKTNSSYNIASIASSTSFDMGSGKYSLNTPTSTDDGSIFTFKTCTGFGGSCSSEGSQQTPQVKDLNASIPYWRSSRLVADRENDEEVDGTRSPEHSGDEAEDCSDAKDTVDFTDFTSINVALQKSVAIPLYTQLRLANETVLKYFFHDLDLFSHFLSLRSFFFLMDGEYSRTMTNSLFHKIAAVRQPSHLLNYVVLNALLRKSLDASLSGTEENAKKLSFKVNSTPDHFRLTSTDVLECLSLRYHTEWPLNIIITEQSLSKYNHIFTFLLKVRLVSWRLEEGFNKLKCAGGKNFGGGSKQYHSVQLWRHEMMHFVRSVQNYIMATALQSSWELFEQELNQVHTLDDLYRTHVTYVKHILYRCFLYKHSRSLHSALMKVFNAILKFHVQLEASQWHQSEPDKPAQEHPDFRTLTNIHDNFQSLAGMLYKFVEKLVQAGYQTHLCELLEMLNANGYYTPVASG